MNIKYFSSILYNNKIYFILYIFLVSFSFLMSSTVQRHEKFPNVAKKRHVKTCQCLCWCCQILKCRNIQLFHLRFLQLFQFLFLVWLPFKFFAVYILSLCWGKSKLFCHILSINDFQICVHYNLSLNFCGVLTFITSWQKSSGKHHLFETLDFCQRRGDG